MILIPKTQFKTIYDIDPTGNLDGDELDNSQELALGTNLLLSDTDGDGLSDSDEFNGPIPTNTTITTDPLKPDTDNDGLNDLLEVNNYVTFGFDPTLADSDLILDGVSDYTEWEIIEASLVSQDPVKSQFVTQALITGNDDWDEDGVIDLHESIDRTSAIDPNDYFTKIRFDRLGQINRASYAYEIDNGITSTRLNYDAVAPAAGLPGGISHHELKDGSRIRFSFGDDCNGSSVGIVALSEARPGIPAPIRLEVSDDGTTKTVSVIGGLNGAPVSFIVNDQPEPSLLEIHLEMNNDFQRIKIGLDFAIIHEIDIPVLDLDTTPFVVKCRPW